MERIAIISYGGAEGAGAAAGKITRDVTNIISQLPEVIESLTGIDVIGSIRNLPGVTGSNGAGPADSNDKPEDEAVTGTLATLCSC